MPNEFHQKLSQIIRSDARFRPQAYQFLFQGLDHTITQLGLAARPAREERHVSGQQLCDGIRDLALRRFGYLAGTVFELWGVTRTDDWGAIVFNLVDASLMSKNDADSPADFHELHEYGDALELAYFRDRWYSRDTADSTDAEGPDDD